MKTPTTDKGLRKYDHLPPIEAVRKAWEVKGVRPFFHDMAKGQVHSIMPLLARALDRLEQE